MSALAEVSSLASLSLSMPMERDARWPTARLRNLAHNILSVGLCDKCSGIASKVLLELVQNNDEELSIHFCEKAQPVFNLLYSGDLGLCNEDKLSIHTTLCQPFYQLWPHSPINQLLFATSSFPPSRDFMRQTSIVGALAMTILHLSATLLTGVEDPSDVLRRVHPKLIERKGDFAAILKTLEDLQEAALVRMAFVIDCDVRAWHGQPSTAAGVAGAVVGGGASLATGFGVVTTGVAAAAGGVGAVKLEQSLRSSCTKHPAAELPYVKLLDSSDAVQYTFNPDSSGPVTRSVAYVLRAVVPGALRSNTYGYVMIKFGTEGQESDDNTHFCPFHLKQLDSKQPIAAMDLWELREHAREAMYKRILTPERWLEIIRILKNSRLPNSAFPLIDPTTEPLLTSLLPFYLRMLQAASNAAAQRTLISTEIKQHILNQLDRRTWEEVRKYLSEQLVLCKINFPALGQRESSLKSPNASSSVLNQYE